MAEFNPNPFRGEASVPHVSEEFFKMYFVGCQLALVFILNPGRIFGSQIKPQRWTSDYITSVCDEAARRREGQRAKRIPRSFMMAPSPTTHSWEKMWYAHLHHKRWTKQRQGNGWVRLP